MRPRIWRRSDTSWARGRLLPLAAAATLVLCVLPGRAAAAAGGSRLWLSSWDGGGDEAAHSMAVSPDGSRVFVTGQSDGGGAGWDYATVALSASDGTLLWAARYDGTGHGDDFAHQVVVGPDGSRVFVTGKSRGDTTHDDYATVAYDASTGAELWVARYDGPADQDDAASSVATSPDGSKVVVTGGSYGTENGRDFATVAYDATTGSQLWVARYDGPGHGYDFANSVAAGPGGVSVFVTGRSLGTSTGYDFATVAYDVTTGARQWTHRFSGAGKKNDTAVWITAGPGGREVYVTGSSIASATGVDYATVAYRTGNGSQVWASRYAGPATTGNRADSPVAVVADPDGRHVFVTGQSNGRGTGRDYATVSYRTGSGAQAWVSRYDGHGTNGSADIAASVAVSPSGASVYVTGTSDGAGTGFDYATVAYGASSGGRLWVARYTIQAIDDEDATSVAVSPNGARVFVTGYAQGITIPTIDYLTIAYSA